MAENNSELPTKPPIWNDPKYRALFFQVLLIGALSYFFYSIVSNAIENLQSRGIATGFSFMGERSGFDLLFSLFDYTSDSTYGDTFLVGLLNTLLIGVLGIILATLIGFSMGVARLSNNWIIAKIATFYVEIFRNIPLIIQLFFWYIVVLKSMPAVRQSYSAFDSFFVNNRGIYTPAPVTGDGFIFTTIAFIAGIIGVIFLSMWAKKKQEKTGETTPVSLYGLLLIIVVPLIVFFISGSPLTWDYPSLQGFNFGGGIEIIPELLALVVGLSVYTGSFIAEIVRSGILAVNKGQTEAALSVGLSPSQNLKLVVIPQAMRVIIPPLTSQYLNLVKNLSLCVAVAYPDLVAVFMGTTLNQTGQAIEITALTMAVYLTLSLLISAFMNWYNAKMSLVER